MRVGVLTVSDGCFRGQREDRSGALISDWAAARGYVVAASAVVPDEAHAIVPVLMKWADELDLGLVLTTGGTGLAPRDVTPEATRSVLEREAPGIAEAIRGRGSDQTPFAVLSRGLAGVRGGTLFVNLPGSPNGVKDGLGVLEEVVEHAVSIARGEDPGHEQAGVGGAS